MEKLSQEERVKIARCMGIAKAFLDAGYSLDSVKLAMDDSMPEGIEKEAVWGAIARGLGRLGKWFIRGAKSSRATRMGSKAIKPGKSSFNTLEGIRRNIGMDLTRWGKKPGGAAWETGKGIVGNMIFPGMIKSKSTIGKGLGTGIFAKNMMGPMFGGGGDGAPGY